MHELICCYAVWFLETSTKVCISFWAHLYIKWSIMKGLRTPHNVMFAAPLWIKMENELHSGVGGENLVSIDMAKL